MEKEADVKVCIVCGRTEHENVPTDCIVQANFDIETQRFKSGFNRPYQKSLDKSILKQGINNLCSNRSNCNQRMYANRKQHRLNFPYENLKEEHALFILKEIYKAKFESHSFINVKDRKFYLCDGGECSIQINYDGNIFIEVLGSNCSDGLTYLKIYNYLQSQGYSLPKTK